MPYKSKRRYKRQFTREQCSKGGRAIRGGEFAEEVRQRALQDAKGMILREGVTYTANGEQHWQKRRALFGRTDQVELICNGKVVLTTGETLLRNKLRWLAR